MWRQEVVERGKRTRAQVGDGMGEGKDSTGKSVGEASDGVGQTAQRDGTDAGERRHGRR